MNNLIALIPVYNAEESIYECLLKLDQFVDEIYVLEGSWLGYNQSLRSTDNTILHLERFQRKANHPYHFLSLSNFLNQWEARNILISKVDDGDYFFNIDSDEIVVSYPKDIHKILEDTTNKGLCGLKIMAYEYPQTMDKAKYVDLPKIIRKTNGLRMTTNHRYYEDMNGNQLIYHYEKFGFCSELVVDHRTNKAFRPQAEEYKKWLVGYESIN